MSVRAASEQAPVMFEQLDSMRHVLRLLMAIRREHYDRLTASWACR